MGSVSESGKSLEGGNSNTLQYSCLDNPMDREAWRATVHRDAKSPTQLKHPGMQEEDVYTFCVCVCVCVYVCVCVCVSYNIWLKYIFPFVTSSESSQYLQI